MNCGIYFVLSLFGLCVSRSLQCTTTFHDLSMSSNSTAPVNNTTVRSMVECSVSCASQNCASFSFDSQTKLCTTYINDNYNETGHGESGNSTTSCKTSTLSRSDLVDCGDLCCSDCSGVYRITPVPEKSFNVFCDTETAGGPWTVIQRRMDGSVDFYRTWDDYKWGFGNLDGEHWLGLEYIYSLLSLGQQLYIHLEGWDGTTAYASYQDFFIGNESSKYQLTVGGFSGNIQDSFTQHSTRNFSTIDADNDENPNRHCARFGQGGWWYRNCYSANLNGLYTVDQGFDVSDSMNWNNFYYGRRQAPLRKSSMMVKRKS